MTDPSPPPPPFVAVTRREKRAWDRGKLEGLYFAAAFPDQVERVAAALDRILTQLEAKTPLPAPDADPWC